MAPSKTVPLPSAPTAAVDYETFYRATKKKDPAEKAKDVSASTQSYWHYTHHLEFYAYLVSIVTTDGLEWVGDPKDAPWEKIKGHIWVSRNSPFDRSVHVRLQEDGIVPSWWPIYWGNSADLAAWMRHPRSLMGSIEVAFGITMDKSFRSDMNGVHYRDLSDEQKERGLKYALEDSRLDLKYWVKYIGEWPDKERRLADLYVERSLRGLYADKKGIEEDMEVLLKVRELALSKIPWKDEYAALSKVGLAKECAKHGIQPPVTLDNKSPELAAWEDEYGEKFPFVAAMRDYRRSNTFYLRYKMTYDRIMPNGRFQISLSYLGTQTGRSSGTDRGDEERDSMNLLNMPRDPIYVRADYTLVSSKAELKEIMLWKMANKDAKTPPPGICYEIDIRGKILPEPGKKFGIIDMAQIECRVRNWLAGNKRVLDFCRKGLSAYEAHAMALMGYTPAPGSKGLKKDNPQLYSLAKGRELALGFQAGHVQFIKMAPIYISEEDMDRIFNKPISPAQEAAYLKYLAAVRQTVYISEYRKGDDRFKRYRVNAWEAVESFRKDNPELNDKETGMWHKLDRAIKAALGGDYFIKLPSGRKLCYFDVQMAEDDYGKVSLHARTERGGKLKPFYGGKLTANATSATARDIFLNSQLCLDDHDIWVCLDVYDETVIEVPVDFDVKVAADLMIVNPDWAKTLPLGYEFEESFHYKK